MVPILEPVIEASEESPKEKSVLADAGAQLSMSENPSQRPPIRPAGHEAAGVAVSDLLKTSASTSAGSALLKAWSEDVDELDANALIEDHSADRRDTEGESSGLRRSIGTLVSAIEDGDIGFGSNDPVDAAGIDAAVDEWEGETGGSSQGSSAFYIGDGMY
jgi:hypothetical protein